MSTKNFRLAIFNKEINFHSLIMSDCVDKDNIQGTYLTVFLFLCSILPQIYLYSPGHKASVLHASLKIQTMNERTISIN